MKNSEVIIRKTESVKNLPDSLQKAIADYRNVEKELDQLDIEIIEEFNSDKK